MENSTATQPRRRWQPKVRPLRAPRSQSTAKRRSAKRGTTYRERIKRPVDLVLGLLLLVLVSPVLLVVAFAVKLDSRGSALFKQRRLGQDMEPFTVFKFRTMAADSSSDLHEQYIAELANGSSNGNGNGEIKKLTADPRVTTVGKVLRRTSLDELPQLLNVVNGTMSLVGPRPALEYELKHYDRQHLRRFDVRPGITGLWQVSGRNRLDFHEMLDLDIEYQPSLATDLGILVRTPIAAFRHVA